MRNSDRYSISLMCEVLHVSRASFYHYFYYSNSNNDKVDLLIKILNIYNHSKRTYGSPRIAAVLRNEGLNISIKTVAKYMRILDIQSISKAKFPKKKSRITDKEKSLIINLIKDINITHPNQVWTTDITYIKIKGGSFVYLSSIIDLFSRKVIAWNIGNNMKTDLVLETLENAFKLRGNPINVIIHSDKGSQYRSHKFRKLILKHHCLFSYTSLNHSCDENANQESFHATLKKEWLYQFDIHSLDHAKRVVFEYIEGFYNNNRIHSSLGFLSPISFENNYYFQIPPVNAV